MFYFVKLFISIAQKQVQFPGGDPYRYIPLYRLLIRKKNEDEEEEQTGAYIKHQSGAVSS
jgi:hypothetical protein